MFYYKTSFSKKAVILLKTAKNPFVRGHDYFENRGCLATKINVTFFVGIDVFNIFHSTTFSKKNNIFQNNSEKLLLAGMTIFEGTGRQTTKMNITFFWGNGIPNTVLFFFSKNAPYRLT